MSGSCRCFWWLLLLLCCCLVSSVTSSSLAVTHLPGFEGPLPFSLETGYVKVDERTGVQLFYYFVQSEKDPARDPLVLWMQGGPGCSGFSGLVFEMGPLQFDTKGYESGRLPSLLYRSETWTKVSNIIFLDTPVGAGFSYATSKEGFISSDTMAVKHLVIFLKKWLHEHPQFLSNPLYVGGESYCGITIPTLALAIDTSNEESGEEQLLNLKGYYAGNPVTDVRFDKAGQVQFYNGMGLISDELYERAKENCRGNYTYPPNVLCEESMQEIYECTKDLDWGYILEPWCPYNWSPRIPSAAMREGSSWWLKLQYSDGLMYPFKCRKSTYMLSYIWANHEAVRESLGIRKGTTGEWKRCNRDIPYTSDITTTVDHHLRLRKKGYPALIYSGDHDSGIPFVGTQAWIRSLKLSITDEWRPWYVDGQVAGYTRTYSSNLTFATVKGAGHTTPEYKPKECLAMFARWISGEPL